MCPLQCNIAYTSKQFLFIPTFHSASICINLLYWPVFSSQLRDFRVSPMHLGYWRVILSFYCCGQKSNRISIILERVKEVLRWHLKTVPDLKLLLNQRCFLISGMVNLSSGLWSNILDSRPDEENKRQTLASQVFWVVLRCFYEVVRVFWVVAFWPKSKEPTILWISILF